jgi:hypothetical protein
MNIIVNKTKNTNTQIKIPVNDRIKIAQREHNWAVLVDKRCYATGVSKEVAFSIADKLLVADQ